MERSESVYNETDRDSDEPSEDEEEQVKEFDPYKLIWEVFLPAAITYGIPYETFWDMCPRELEIYRRAYMDSEKHYLEQQELVAYMQGIYNQYAISSVLNGRKSPYPKKPLGIFKLEEKELDPETERKLILQRAEAWAIDANSKGLPDSGMK